MLIKIKGKHKNIKVFEHGNGAYLITSLGGKNITVIDGKHKNAEKELERINELQGRRMKQEGWQ